MLGRLAALAILASACAAPADPPKDGALDTVDLSAEEEVDLTSTDFAEEAVGMTDIPGVVIEDNPPPSPE